MENRRGDDGIPEDFALGFEALIADEPDADSPPAAAPVWRTHGTPPSWSGHIESQISGASPRLLPDATGSAAPVTQHECPRTVIPTAQQHPIDVLDAYHLNPATLAAARADILCS